MLVMAKCTARAWDSKTAREFFPGVEYEIDSESELASLTTVPVGYDDKGNPVQFYRDPAGAIKTRPTVKPPYVFQFDRNQTRTNDGVVVEKDYSCKKCGAPFKTLAALGLHTVQNHKNDELIPSDEPVDLSDKTCPHCKKVLKNAYGLRLHMEKSHSEVKDAVAV